MATLAKQQIVLTGLTPVYSAVNGGGDKAVPADGSFLHFKNTNAATFTVNVDDPTSVAPVGAQAFNADLSVIIPATNGDKMIGPIGARFASPADGLAAITYTGTTTNGTVASLQV